MFIDGKWFTPPYFCAKIGTKGGVWDETDRCRYFMGDWWGEGFGAGGL